MGDLMSDLNIPFVVQHMKVQDVPEVMAIEKTSFPLPWPATAYRHELTHNKHSHYIVVRKRGPPTLPLRNRWFDHWFGRTKPRPPLMVGYGGFWVLDKEAHISTIAVRPDWRGRGIGELLLAAMIDLARTLNAQVVTLEVRVSNEVAQNLYRKYMFKETGYRRRYYRDNDEDALSMATPPIDNPAFLLTYYRHCAAFSAKLRNLAISNEPQTIRDERRKS